MNQFLNSISSAMTISIQSSKKNTDLTNLFIFFYILWWIKATVCPLFVEAKTFRNNTEETEVVIRIWTRKKIIFS